ncbi:MAG: hypothetical protein H8E66_19720 [Planctomycetes bacterium]|nr:hypothetical protein [Planctomycetota bacterium]
MRLSKSSSVTSVSLLAFLLLQSAISFAQNRIELASADLLDVTLIGGDHNMANDVMRESDENKDGVLDAKEMGQLKWLIEPRRFDLNRNDKLTNLEVAIHFANMRKQFEITVPDMYNATRMINLYDGNGDRLLSEKEAQTFPLTNDISIFDANKDGRLSPFELGKQLAADFQDLGVEALDQWNALQYVRKNDKDGDQQLSLEETKTAQWPADPKTYDANRNGKLVMHEIAMGLSMRKQDNGIARSDQANAQRFFMRYDLNRDRFVDADEMEKTGWPSDPALFDTDKDGKITVFEVAARFAKKRQDRGVEQEDRFEAARLLKLYDKNKNSFIDLNELVADRSAVGLLSEDVFLEFDSDTNQKMSRMEIATYLSHQRRKKDKKAKDPFR